MREILKKLSSKILYEKASRQLKVFITKPEGFFLIFAAFFGFIFVFLTPPMQTPDEQTHFFQSYAVSNLDFVPQRFEQGGMAHYGAELPKSIFQAARALSGDVAGVSETRFNKHLFVDYADQPLRTDLTSHEASGSSYAPIVYIPQATGITVGKIFDASPLIMIWLGRLANLAAWVAIIYFAIRIMPFGKWAMAILALNPMAVFLSASLSADVMTTALAFLFFSIVATTLSNKQILSKKKLIAIFVTLIMLVLTKPTNMIFALLLLAIPWKNFKNKRNYALFCFGAIGGALLTILLWNSIVSEANQFTANIQAAGRTLDPSAQLAGIIHDPLNYLKLILINYVLILPVGYPGDFTLTSVVGALGWGERSLPLWTIILYIVSVFFTFLHMIGRGGSLTKPQKLTILSVFALFVVANITALYIYVNAVGQSIILGVQGRYFIPSSILLAVLFTGYRKKTLTISDNSFVIAIGSITLIVLCTTTLTILLRYYG